ncbi:hypothetical protein JCM8097_008507 [Rhodosporidiobolus ruineniae]
MPKYNSKQKNPSNVYNGYRGMLMNPQSSPYQRELAHRQMTRLERGESLDGQSGTALVHSNNPLPSMSPSLSSSSSSALMPFQPSQLAQFTPAIHYPGTGQVQHTQRIQANHPSFKGPIDVTITNTYSFVDGRRV